MILESYSLNYPYLEMIYYEEEDPQSTCIKAQYQLVDNFCAQRYEYTIRIEGYDYSLEDISQKYVPLPFPDWLEEIPKPQKEQVLKEVISYCRNGDHTGMVNFFT
jgi:hypothetical protein